MDPDSVRGLLDGQPPAVGGQRPLRRRVVQERAGRVERHRRGDVHDHPGPALAHLGQQRRVQPDGGQEVDVQRVPPLLVRDGARALRVDPCGTGVVHQDVHPAELFQRGVGKGPDTRWGAQVGGDELGPGRGVRGGRARGGEHGSSRVDQSLRDGRAEPSRSAGDQGPLAVQLTCCGCHDITVRLLWTEGSRSVFDVNSVYAVYGDLVYAVNQAATRSITTDGPGWVAISALTSRAAKPNEASVSSRCASSRTTATVAVAGSWDRPTPLLATRSADSGLSANPGSTSCGTP